MENLDANILAHRRVDSGEYRGFEEEKKYTDTLPEEILDLQRKAQEMVDGNARFFSLYAKDVSLRFKMSRAFYINLENGEVNLNTRWFAERGMSPKQILWACLHELSHFRDLAEDPEGMMKGFEHIKNMARKTGAAMMRKWEDAAAGNEEFLDRLRTPGKNGLTPVEAVAKKIHDTFYSIFDDIYVNAMVARKAGMFSAGSSGAEEVERLYREELFEDSDYRNYPRHLQFLYKLIREQMVPDEEVLVSDEVKAFLEKKILFQGKEYTPREIAEQFLKPRKGKDTRVRERYFVLQMTLEPLFEELLEMDLADWEPKVPEEKEQQQKEDGGQGEEGTDEKQESDEEESGEGNNQEGDNEDGSQAQDGSDENEKEGNGDGSPENAESEEGGEHGKQEDENGGNGKKEENTETQKGEGETGDHGEEEGGQEGGDGVSSGEGNERESDGGGISGINPFEDFQNSFDQNSIDQIGEEDIRNWMEKHREEKEREAKEREEKEREAKKTSEERENERRELEAREWCAAHDVNYEKTYRAFKKIETEIEPYLAELSALWRHIVYGSSRQTERGLDDIYYRSGDVLDVDEAVRQWGHIERGDPGRAKVMRRWSEQEAIAEKPELIRVRIVGDMSDSMDLRRIHILRQCFVLLLSSLEEFNHYLNMERGRTKSRMRADTEAWVFGSGALRVKEFEGGDATADMSARKFKAFEALGSTIGETRDDKALGAIADSISPADEERMRSGKVMDIVFEITDGGSSNEDGAKAAVDDLVSKGVIARAFQIGEPDSEERAVFNSVWNNKDRGEPLGERVANIEELIPAVVRVLKKYLKNVRL